MRAEQSFKALSACLLAMMLSAPCLAIDNGVASPEKLKEALKTIYATKNAPALRQLYLPRADKLQMDANIQVVSWDLEKDIHSIEVKKFQRLLPSSYQQASIGRAYCPSPMGEITIHFADKHNDTAVFDYGEENGRFYLVTTCS